MGWSPFKLPHDVEGRYQLSFIRNGHILFSLGGKSGGGVVEVPVVVRYSEYSLRKGQSSIAAFRIAFDYLMKRIFR